jgi:putative photosynthetic complex assembly protein
MSQASLGERKKGHESVPRAVLRGAAVLIGFALVAAGVARRTDIGTLHMPAAEAVETLSLKFEDRPDGAVAVYEARDGLIYVVQPGTYGFIRSTLRGLARERRRADLDAAAPFVLTRWSDGTVSLEDPGAHRRVDLDAFGPDNARAFAQLFDERRTRP